MSKTILMIHGMWGGAWYWESYRGFFEQAGYQCVVPNLRFHDVSPDEEPDPALGTTSLLDYAEDLEKLILELDEKPIIMGHSMGGLLAQILASRGFSESIVLLAPAAPAGINAITPSVIKAFLKIHTQWGFWKKPMRQAFDVAAYSVFNMMPPDEQRVLFDKGVYESGRVATEVGFWLLDRNHASRVDASKVICPVLVIAGAKDRITPPSVVRKVARKYQTVSTYREFENHAHWLVGEPGWQEVAKFALDWLGKLSR